MWRQESLTPTPAATNTPPVAAPVPGQRQESLTPTPDSANTAPEVGVSAQVTKAAILQLSGSALDETLPDGQLTTRWSKVSGPGPVVFADPTKVDTTATFTAAGTYVLRLTATDGEFTVTDDVTVVVQP